MICGDAWLLPKTSGSWWLNTVSCAYWCARITADGTNLFSFLHRITFCFSISYIFYIRVLCQIVFGMFSSHILLGLSTVEGLRSALSFASRASLPYIPSATGWGSVYSRGSFSCLYKSNDSSSICKNFHTPLSSLGVYLGPLCHVLVPSLLPTPVLVSVARQCTSKPGWGFYTTLNYNKPQAFLSICFFK